MKWTRRDIIKGLGGLPIAGAIWWAGASSSVQSSKERTKLLEQLNIEPSLSKALPPIGGAPVRVGIIGFGIRGEQLCRSLGFATKAWLDNMDNKREKIMEVFKKHYKNDAKKWFEYWRVFYMSCEELFRYNKGNEWFVSHYLFEKKSNS